MTVQNNELIQEIAIINKLTTVVHPAGFYTTGRQEIGLSCTGNTVDTNVSGGQKQRLCIARALLKKPKILILDDSTSAVDTRTDALIRQAFREEIPGTTKLIIAQRVASVQDADMIVIMENGMVNAVGTHEELLNSSVIYQEVFESQQKGGK